MKLLISAAVALTASSSVAAQSSWYNFNGMAWTNGGLMQNAGTQQTVEAYGQCGGKSLPSGGQDGPVYGCTPGYSCGKVNEWYWQCLPSNNPPSTGQVGPWEQCGGKGANGQSGKQKDCTAGYACTMVNEWYWQCTPGGGSNPNPPPPNPAPAPQPTQSPPGPPQPTPPPPSGGGNPVANYQQCGGKSLPGGRDQALYPCNIGHSCVRVDEWYWQCKPSNTPPNPGQKAAWEQCGGQSGKQFDCTPGYSCNKLNDYYWQCTPVGGQNAGPAGPPSPPAGPPSTTGGQEYPPAGPPYPTPPAGHPSTPGGQEYPPAGTPYPPMGPSYPSSAPTPPGGQEYPPAGTPYPPMGPSYPSSAPTPPSGPPSTPSQPQSPPMQKAENYGQCGGKSLPNGQDKAQYSCNPGYDCARSNEWYWQCVPTKPQPVGNQKLPYEQCGGKGLQGQDAKVYDCTAGYKCLKLNEWYWQCVPQSQNGAGQDGAFFSSYARDAAANQAGGQGNPYGLDPQGTLSLAENSPYSPQYWMNYMKNAASDSTSEEGGMGTTTIIVVAVVGALGVSLFALLVVLIVRGRRRRRAAAALAQPFASPNTSPPSNGPYHKADEDFKLNL